MRTLGNKRQSLKEVTSRSPYCSSSDVTAKKELTKILGDAQLELDTFFAWFNGR